METLKIGDKVEGRFGDKWYPGKIVAMTPGDSAVICSAAAKVEGCGHDGVTLDGWKGCSCGSENGHQFLFGGGDWRPLASAPVPPLDQIAVRVETEEESRAVQERFFALGKMWIGEEKKEYFNFVHDLPENIYINKDQSDPRYDGKLIRGPDRTDRTTITAAAFLAAYPAPAKPEPVKEPEPVYYTATYHTVGSAGTFEIAEQKPLPCPRCGLDMNVAGNICVDGIAVGCHECLKALMIKEGWLKPARAQTRAEALEALEALRAAGCGPRPSEMAHKGWPRGGDRA